MIELFVHGRAATAGSKTGFYNKKTGKVIMAPASKRQKPWMESVKWAAIQKGYNGKMLIEGPVFLEITFFFMRPKGHYKKSGGLTKSARRYPSNRPDLSKLTRAVEDALSSLIYHDDSQIVTQHTQKRYCSEGQPQGAQIKIEEI